MPEITPEYLTEQRRQFVIELGELAAKMQQVNGAIALVDHLLAILDVPGNGETDAPLPGLPLYKGADGELHYDGIPETLTQQPDGGNHARES